MVVACLFHGEYLLRTREASLLPDSSYGEGGMDRTNQSQNSTLRVFIIFLRSLEYPKELFRIQLFFVFLQLGQQGILFSLRNRGCLLLLLNLGTRLLAFVSHLLGRFHDEFDRGTRPQIDRRHDTIKTNATGRPHVVAWKNGGKMYVYTRGFGNPPKRKKAFPFMSRTRTKAKRKKTTSTYQK